MIYREVSRDDGSIITAYFATQVSRRQILWRKRTAVAKALDDISAAVPHLLRLPQGKAWIDYDEEADVLYISLKRPQKATDTRVLAGKGILLRYRAKNLVGVTVLDASNPRKQRKVRT